MFQSMGSQRVGHHRATELNLFIHLFAVFTTIVELQGHRARFLFAFLKNSLQALLRLEHTFCTA